MDTYVSPFQACGVRQERLNADFGFQEIVQQTPLGWSAIGLSWVGLLALARAVVLLLVPLWLAGRHVGTYAFVW